MQIKFFEVTILPLFFHKFIVSMSMTMGS